VTAIRTLTTSFFRIITRSDGVLFGVLRVEDLESFPSTRSDVTTPGERGGATSTANAPSACLERDDPFSLRGAETG
jgi:hypothetical protein